MPVTKTFAYKGDDTIGAVVIARLQEAGYTYVDSLADAEFVMTYCTSQTVLEDVYFDEDGLIQLAQPYTVFIDFSASTPSFAQELNAVALVNDLATVEAPLVVLDLTQVNAFDNKANLACFVGGDKNSVQAALPVIECVVGEVWETGEAGSAQLARAAYTLQTTAQIISAVEADALYRATRVSLALTGAKPHHAKAATPLSKQIISAVENGRFDGAYTVEMFMAELAAALTAADDADLILPQSEACLHLLELLAVIGGSDKTPAALSLVYGDESLCAEQGLDWTRAEKTYSDTSKDSGIETYDEIDEECRYNSDYDKSDSYSGFSTYPGYSAN